MLKSFYISGDELKKKLKSYRSKGFFSLVAATIKVIFKVYLKNFCFYYYFRIFKRYRFNDRSYGLFYHPYNKTWQNERAVEIPIIWEAVKKESPKEILELGNVLSHYFSFEHDVIDKYEKSPGVINQDIVEFKPKKKYNLIVSVSTLEHIGYDEKTKDPTKILKAIDVLKKNLHPSGRIIATVPFGENPYLDRLVKENKLPFKKQLYLKRINQSKWSQVDRKSILDARYGHPYPAGNAIIVGEI